MKIYGPGDKVPEGVDLAVTIGPWWTMTAIDQVWNHIAAMHVEWSDPAGAPGHWARLPNGQALLIVTSYGEERRHPDLDRTRHASAAVAMQVAWDAGLLGVIVFPDLKERGLGRRRDSAWVSPRLAAVPDGNQVRTTERMRGDHL